MARVYNFSAGPSMLPESVLKKAAAEMLDYEGSGQSVMEMSHRSKIYGTIIEGAEALLREVMNIPDNYKVLFLQGGASTQFAAIPMNLMTKSGKADYVITGQWAKKAHAEAARYGQANVVASSADKTFTYIPKLDPSTFTKDADYFYICMNNTIYGTVYHELPDKSEFRFYNISSQINKDKKHYYNILEKTQHGDGNITEWISWYAETLSIALDDAETVVSGILNKSYFWQRASSLALSQRQTDVINIFLDGYEAKITSKTWASLANCSKDTAIRDIQDLIGKGILREDIPGAKRPSYSIIMNLDDITEFFTNIEVCEENGI